jgi:gliding motility associated protien GldN
MKKIISVLTVVVLLAGSLAQSVMAQSIQNDQQREEWIYNKQIGQRAPAPYPPLREADVMWAKKVWRLIDLREKVNQPLYYPTRPKGDWYSLIDVILNTIKSGENVYAYDADEGDDMTVQITQAEINKKFGAGVDSVWVPDLDGSGNGVWEISENEVRSDEVKQYIVQEVWYFDSKLSSLQVRLLGICPIRISVNNETNSLEKRKLFWIKYDPFRRAFANYEAFNRFNDAKRISYDDMFLQRRFNGYILAESNVYDNRSINDYEIGRNALVESERIKKVIFDFEQDLWEY